MDNLTLKPGKDYIGIGVFVLITNSNNKIILTKANQSEKKGEDYKDIWSMPGGTLEFGENAEDCLIREIKEELGININNIKLLNYNDYIKNNRHWLALNFSAETDETVRNLEPEKNEVVSEFSITEMPKDVSPYTRECLDLLSKN